MAISYPYAVTYYDRVQRLRAAMAKLIGDASPHVNTAAAQFALDSMAEAEMNLVSHHGSAIVDAIAGAAINADREEVSV